VAGEIREVRVKQGDLVHAGDVLVVLANPEIEAAAQSTQNDLALADAKVRTAAGTGDSAALAKATRQSPAPGTGSGHRTAAHCGPDGAFTHRRCGHFAGYRSALRGIRRGRTDLTSIVNRQAMRARILVRDWDLFARSTAGHGAAQGRAYPYRTFQWPGRTLMPAAAAEIPVAADAELLRYGGI